MKDFPLLLTAVERCGDKLTIKRIDVNTPLYVCVLSPLAPVVGVIICVTAGLHMGSSPTD